jgi:hypothetical protein
LTPGRAGTFEENNDDPEVMLKFNKKPKKSKSKVSPNKEVKMELTLN